MTWGRLANNIVLPATVVVVLSQEAMEVVQQGPVDADVIIVGSGGAGLAAALDAREAGASVVILEREEEMGGATAISGGGCFIAATPLQRERGIEDSPDLALADWFRFGQGSADEECARFYIDHS